MCVNDPPAGWKVGKKKRRGWIPVSSATRKEVSDPTSTAQTSKRPKRRSGVVIQTGLRQN